MEVVKVTKDYTIIKKKNGRYGVRRPNRHWINGAEKVEILLAEGLIKAPAPKPEAKAEEAPQEEEAEASAEEPAPPEGEENSE